MKEINKIVVDTTALRIMKDGERQWCEILESNKWSRISSAKLHQLLFDGRVYNWLNQHHNSANNALKASNNKRTNH